MDETYQKSVEPLQRSNLWGKQGWGKTGKREYKMRKVLMKKE